MNESSENASQVMDALFNFHYFSKCLVNLVIEFLN